MSQKFCTWILLIIQLLSISFSSCRGRDSNQCVEKGTKAEYVQFEFPPKIRIDYSIDEKFVDISDGLGFGKWGSEVIKRYVNGYDTLTLKWNHSFRPINDTVPIYWLTERIKSDSIYHCKHSIYPINLNEIKGAICEVECKDHAQMIFFGSNSFSEKHLVARYTTRRNNLDFKVDFLCILNSMTFR